MFQKPMSFLENCNWTNPQGNLMIVYRSESRLMELKLVAKITKKFQEEFSPFLCAETQENLA